MARVEFRISFDVNINYEEKKHRLVVNTVQLLLETIGSAIAVVAVCTVGRFGKYFIQRYSLTSNLLF